jgi:hypothetical protein
MTQNKAQLPHLYGGRAGQLGLNHEVAAIAAADDDGESNNENHLFSAHIKPSLFSSAFNNTQK